MKQRIMLDGARIGTKLETLKGSLKISNQEEVILRKIFNLNNAVLNGLDLELVVTNKSSMMLTLRRDIKNKDSYYLNLSGNPLTFFEGSNVYGWPEADTQIVKAFKYCISKAQNTAKLHFPLRIRECILDLNFHISSLEFACYTGKIKAENKIKVLNAWDYVYRTSDSYDGLLHKSLENMLSVRRVNTEYENSFCLAILRFKRVESYLMVYDKEAEMEAKGLNNYIPDDIKDRLRVELNLSNEWFTNNKIKTMRNLVERVEKDGGWISFIELQMVHAFNRSCLLHMFTFKEDSVLSNTYSKIHNPDNLNTAIPIEAYQAMLYARSMFNVTMIKWKLQRGNNKPLLTKLESRKLPTYLIAQLQLEPIKAVIND